MARIGKAALAVMVSLALWVPMGSSAWAGVSPPPPDLVFTDQAQAPTGFATTCPGTEWRWVPNWTYSKDGLLWYAFGVTSQFCGYKGKVVSTGWSLSCYSIGTWNGWSYQGCSQSRTAFGYASIVIDVTWKYQAGCCGAYVHKTPHLQATLYPNGNISGEVWFQ